MRIEDFTGIRIAVLGDLMLDTDWSGKTARLSPEAPVQVVRVDKCSSRPGGAGNVALGIAALGAAVSLYALTGNDRKAKELQEKLQSVEVDCAGIFEVAGWQTIEKLRIKCRNTQLLRLDFETLPESGHDLAAGLEQSLSEHLHDVSAIVISDYNKGTVDSPVKLIAAARKRGIPVLVDPKGEDYSRYRGAAVLTPNLHEFEAVVGSVGDNESLLVEKGLALLEKFSLQALLVTRGEAGMTLLQAGKPEFHLPARRREVYDVTGAGDTVIAVLATALSAGMSLAEATRLSNIAAGIAVSRPGAVQVSAQELRREVLKITGDYAGIISYSQLLLLAQDARAHDERLVLTNGCFDIIHAGHVETLEQAAALGDKLIVAVNSDDSVRRLKGAGRPINSLEHRMAVLAALECVDWVVAFDEDTPRRMISELQPEVLAKGGDYSRSEVVGYDIVDAYGGEVVVLPLVENTSTTNIARKLKMEAEKSG